MHIMKYEIDLATPLNNAYHCGVEFLWGILMAKIKPATTFEEQINIFYSRGLLIENRASAMSTLSRMNYYTISGYIHAFKESEEKYTVGLSFDKVYKIIEFDRRFRNVLLYSIEMIEQALKTKLAYNFAHEYGPTGYLDCKNFLKAEDHKKLLKNLSRNVYNNRNLPFIKHHTKKYDGQLPLWVAVEVFTLGMLYHFYINMPTKNKKEIAREFNTGVKQLSSWLENITYLRNLIAHYMRLYNFRIQKTPAFCHNNHKTKINSYLVFDIVYIMKILVQDIDEWNGYIIPNINSLFDDYREHIDIKSIGFPENWQDLLEKQSDPQII